jgi:plastocyanin
MVVFNLRRVIVGTMTLGPVILTMACGKSDPAPSGGGGSGNGPTITITASGASPRAVTVSPGTQVTFVNNDSRSHEMTSDPHPTHEDCPPINQVGTLAPGQTRQTGNLNATGRCGFHDHNLPQNTSLQGTITIQ